jgi:hypothetical protein
MHDVLSRSLSHYGYVLERLRQDFPDADEETLLDTVEGLSDLDEVIAAIVRSRLDDLAFVEALQQRRDAMNERLARLKARAEHKKLIVAEAMGRAGLKTILREDMTITLRPGSFGLQVVEENAIPEPYWRPQPPKLDRQAVLSALKEGVAVPGAALTNPAPTIAVRTR